MENNINDATTKEEVTIPKELEGSDHFLLKTDRYMINWLNFDGSVSSSDNFTNSLIDKLSYLLANDEKIVKVVAEVEVCKSEHLVSNVRNTAIDCQIDDRVQSRKKMMELTDEVKLLLGEETLNMETGEIPIIDSRQLLDAILEYYSENEVRIYNHSTKFRKTVSKVIRDIRYPEGFDKNKIPKYDRDNHTFDYGRINAELRCMESKFHIERHAEYSIVKDVDMEGNNNDGE